MLQEDHRVLAADRGAEQPGGVERGRRHDHPQPRQVREQHLRRLAVVHRAAGEIPAAGRAHDQRRFVGAHRPPAEAGEFAADLHVRRPEVVEELHFRDRTQPAERHTHAQADDGRLRQRGVEHPLGPELALESVAHLEDAALALHFGQRFLPAGVGHILPEHHHPRVALQLGAQGGVDQVHHRPRFRAGGEPGLGPERRRAGVHPRAVQVVVDALLRRPGERQRFLGGGGDFRGGVFGEGVEFLPGGRSRGGQALPQPPDGVAPGLRLALAGGAVVPVLVGERVRVQPDHPRLHQRRAGARPGVPEGLRQGRPGLLVVAAVALEHREVREAPDERGDRAAGGLVLDRHRDRVAVVLDQEHHRQPPEAGAVQRLPELALAGRAVAAADQRDPVALRRRREAGDRVAAQVPLRVGHADRVEELGTDATRMGGEAGGPLDEVRRHLPPAGGGVRGGAPGRGQLLGGGKTGAGGERPVPVIDEGPVGPRAQQRPGGGGHRLVAGGTDLEERLVLPLQQDLPPIQLAGGQHRPVGGEQRLRTKRRRLLRLRPSVRLGPSVRPTVLPIPTVRPLAPVPALRPRNEVRAGRRRLAPLPAGLGVPPPPEPVSQSPLPPGEDRRQVSHGAADRSGNSDRARWISSKRQCGRGTNRNTRPPPPSRRRNAVPAAAPGR